MLSIEVLAINGKIVVEHKVVGDPFIIKFLFKKENGEDDGCEALHIHPNQIGVWERALKRTDGTKSTWRSRAEVLTKQNLQIRILNERYREMVFLKKDAQKLINAMKGKEK